MSMEEILRRYGAPALLVFVGLVAVFLALHLTRLPLLVLAGVLGAAMRRVDATVTTRLTTPPTGPAGAAFAGTRGDTR